jgi:hypothetical protein
MAMASCTQSVIASDLFGPAILLLRRGDCFAGSSRLASLESSEAAAMASCFTTYPLADAQ